MIGCSKSDSVLIGSLPLDSQSENDPSSRTRIRQDQNSGLLVITLIHGAKKWPIWLSNRYSENLAHSDRLNVWAFLKHDLNKSSKILSIKKSTKTHFFVVYSCQENTNF